MSYPHQIRVSAHSFNAKRLPLLVLAAMIAGLLGFAGSATMAAAQTDSVTYKGTVTAQGGASAANVVVTAVALCWGECPSTSASLPDDGAERPLPLGALAFLGETEANSSGKWSLTFPAPESHYGALLFVVWDRDANLATRFFLGPGDPWEDWESASNIDTEMSAGGRVSGRFADSAGGPPLPGDYGLVAARGWSPTDSFGLNTVALDVDPQTGSFTSPAVAPGEYRLAHGNHGGGHPGSNDAARVQIAAGQTADAGTVQMQQAGRITGTVTDSTGRPLSGITVSGRISSVSPSWSMPSSPFDVSYEGYSWSADTGDDGTYSSASALVPGDWELEFVDRDATHTTRPFGTVTSIAPGGLDACAIKTDQTIGCWGHGNIRQADVPDGQYTAVALSNTHGCAIKTDNTIACWGDNDKGQADAPDGQYTAIAVGREHSCAIKTDQTITCWGNSDSYWDSDSRSYKRGGRADAPDGQYTAIATGNNHTCAIKTDQTITCWGDRGAWPFTPEGQYTAIAAGGALAAASSSVCAIKTDQTITCWFRSIAFEDLSDGDVSDVEEYDIPDGQYTAVSVGGHHCAIKTDQTIACWGENWAGQTDAPDGQYTAIAAGSSSSCAIKTDQTIACWGDGGVDAPDGQYTAVTAPGDFTCAIKTDNTVACWGFIGNPHGGRSGSRLELEGISVGSASITIDVRVVDYRLVQADSPGGDAPADTGTDDETTPEDDDDADAAIAQRCFDHHKFGAQPVDVAKSADRQTVLAQLSWGYHESIGCYLTLDDTALRTLQAAPAPQGFPAGDPDAAQQCSAVHKFGAQPVDVAKSADRQTVLAQVSWGYHESIGCYLTLDEAATAALRAANT